MRFLQIAIVVCCLGFLSYWWAATTPSITVPTADQSTSTSAGPAVEEGVRLPELSPGSEPAARQAASDEFLGLADFIALLESGDYQAAVDVYDQIYSTSEESISDRYRRALLEYAANLAALDGRNTTAEDDGFPGVVLHPRALEHSIRLVTIYLELYYRDVDALLLLGQAYRKQEDYPAAVSALQDAYTYSHLPSKQEQIQRTLDQSINMYRQRLAGRGDVEKLVELFRALTAGQPDHTPYFLGLANAYIASGDHDQALATLRYIEHDATVGSRARVLIEEIEDQLHQPEIVVPLRPVGNSYLVKATLNERRRVTLMLDTGASISVIKPTVLASLGGTTGNNARVIQLNTANGMVTAPLVQLESLTVGKQSIQGITVAVIDLTGLSDIDGLLGMDYLGRFRFTVDRDQDALILAK